MSMITCKTDNTHLRNEYVSNATSFSNVKIPHEAFWTALWEHPRKYIHCGSVSWTVTVPVISAHDVYFTNRVDICFKLLVTFHFLQVGHKCKSWCEDALIFRQPANSEDKKTQTRQKVVKLLKSLITTLVDFRLSIFIHFFAIPFQKPTTCWISSVTSSKIGAYCHLPMYKGLSINKVF